MPVDTPPVTMKASPAVWHTSQHRAERSVAVDVVRGMAIFLVALGHTNQGELLRLWWAGETPFATWLDRFIYAFHMPAFFFVAGVFLLPSLAKRGEKRFAIERARTLLYPYVLWLTLGTLSPLVLHKYEHMPMPSVHLYLVWLFTGSFQWFLPTLFFMTMVAMLARRVPMWLLLVVSCALSLATMNAHVPPLIVGLSFFFLGCRCLPFMVLGMGVGNGFARVEAVPRSLALLGMLVCGVLIGLTAGRWSETAGYFVPAGVLGTIMLFLLARALHRSWLARAVAWVGEGSLGIFLLSGYFQGGTRAVITPLVHWHPWPQLILPSLVATVVPAWIYNNRARWKIEWLFVAPWGRLKQAVSGKL